MKDKPNEVEHEEDYEVYEDTPENRAWIGETEPQPIKEKSK